MKTLIAAVLLACSAVTASAQSADDIARLEQRVKALEERLANVEAAVRRASLTPEALKMIDKAQHRMAEDREAFKTEDIMKAESLYIQASGDLSAASSQQLLDSIVVQYPRLNRAGCAQLYRAQQERGEAKERLLKDCIARFANCYYGDGTQVGPYAMLQLAVLYQKQGKTAEAEQLFAGIRKQYPDAVDHSGQLLVAHIR
jgi:TolA-binding protein